MLYSYSVFFFNDTATTEIYTLSLHDALPIWHRMPESRAQFVQPGVQAEKQTLPRSVPSNHAVKIVPLASNAGPTIETTQRSEEHTSELQSRQYLVCRLLLEKKKKYNIK